MIEVYVRLIRKQAITLDAVPVEVRADVEAALHDPA